jgi:hypothetical protein
MREKNIARAVTGTPSADINPGEAHRDHISRCNAIRTPSLPASRFRRAPVAHREMSMKATHQLFISATLATLMGCSADPGTSDPTAAIETGTSQDAVTLIDCQKQVTACTLAAKSLSDLGHCTAQFQGCTAQAATDLIGQGTLLTDCRAATNKCLDGALTSADITKCRGLFEACAKDVAATANGVLGDAISTAKTAVQKTTQTAIDIITAAGGAATGALDTVNACIQESNQCFSGATLPVNVAGCQKAAESCINHAVTLVSTVTDPLPGPNPGEIANGLLQCQSSVTACLDKAISSVDVAACNGALQLCVKNTSGFVDQTVNDINTLLPPFFQLPTLTKPVDCASQAAQCLLAMKSPLDCANQAATCLTK